MQASRRGEREAQCSLAALFHAKQKQARSGQVDLLHSNAGECRKICTIDSNS